MVDSSRAGWGDLLGRLTDGVLALMRAEAAGLRADLEVSLRHLKVVAIFGAVAFACAFWAFGALVAALTLGLGELIPLWLVALLEGLLLLVGAGICVIVIRRRIERWESPFDSARERLEDHAEWWQAEIQELSEPAPDPLAAGAAESRAEAPSPDDSRQDGGAP